MREVLAFGCAVLVLLGCTSAAGLAVADYPATAFGPEGMAVERGVPLAPAPTATGERVAGVPCRRPTLEFHIHAHLAIYVNGLRRPVPATIGMVDPTVRQTATGPFFNAHTCYYELHTHAEDGVIHIEAPAPRAFTLGQFFRLWGQPLNRGRVGSAIGPTRVYVDGVLVTDPPGRIRLTDRSVIQVDVGTVVAPQPVSWAHF